jgi:hypothetical protein
MRKRNSATRIPFSASMAFFIFLAAAPLASQNGRAVIGLSSPIYRMMDSLYLEQGKALPSQARPWTEDEARAALDRLDAETLSDAGHAAYRAILGELDKKRLARQDGFEFDTAAVLTPEFYLRSNMGKDPAAAEEDYVWNHGYDERSPFISVPLEFLFGDSFCLYSDLAFKEERAAVDSAWRTDGSYAEGVLDNHWNVIFDQWDNPRLDLYFPFRAFMATGGKGWDLQFGRDKLSWGNGNSGNLMLSDYSDFYDFVSLSFLSRNFKMTNVYASMYPFLPDAAHTRLDFSAFMGHRLEIRIAERFLIAINESVSLGSFTEDEEPLQDMNFMMVFHNWLSERANSLMSLEFQANPWRYVTLYGQGAMDEFTTQYEADRGGGGGPPIFGGLLGAEGSYPLGPGYLSGSLEYAVTSPWLYNRSAPPYYYNVRRYWSLGTDEYEYVVKPLGYRYGPDALVFYGEVRYDVPAGPSYALDVRYIMKGEKEIGSVWDPAPGDAAPSGVAERSLVIHAGADYPILSWLAASADVYFDFTRDRDHIPGAFRNDFELALGLSARWPR